MPSIQQDLESFNEYVRRKVASGTTAGTIDELYDAWREVNGSAEDALAIAASLRDLEQGETGRTFAAFAEEFSKRNGLSKSS